MEDKMLTCRDCNSEFEFTAGEQEFYAEKELSAPQRCKDCRAQKKAQFNQREMHQAVCAECGADCTVPFKPNGEKPVLCRDCFTK
jgi:CxxC-x17-CxxC domain-containing protein